MENKTKKRIARKMVVLQRDPNREHKVTEEAKLFHEMDTNLKKRYG